jgi:hypothetical protein
VSTSTMKTGAFLMMDALGFKALSRQNPKDLRDKLHGLVKELNWVSDAGNRRRLLGGVLSTAAPLTPTSRGLRSLPGGEISGSKLRDGLGTCEAPFSRELSHATLAQREAAKWPRLPWSPSGASAAVTESQP